MFISEWLAFLGARHIKSCHLRRTQNRADRALCGHSPQRGGELDTDGLVSPEAAQTGRSCRVQQTASVTPQKTVVCGAAFDHESIRRARRGWSLSHKRIAVSGTTATYKMPQRNPADLVCPIVLWRVQMPESSLQLITQMALQRPTVKTDRFYLSMSSNVDRIAAGGTGASSFFCVTMWVQSVSLSSSSSRSRLRSSISSTERPT